MGAKATKSQRDTGVVLTAEPHRRPSVRKPRVQSRPRKSTQSSRGPPCTPVSPSPVSITTQFTATSTDYSSGGNSSARPTPVDLPRRYIRQESSYSASSDEYFFENPTENMAPNPLLKEADATAQPTAPASASKTQQEQPLQEEKDRRIIEAEKILGEIAKEYAAKRAAGLVPTKPVPARTLLWEEMAKKSAQMGRRGQCIFGRDSDNICGCTTYKKKRVPGETNPGGVCECCGHGAPWHRLVGGTMARSTRLSRSILAGSLHGSQLESNVPSEARSSMYDYDSDEDEDEDDEDEDAIANEMAVPSNYYPTGSPPPPQPTLQQQQSGQSGHSGQSSALDRLSMLSIGSSYGFPSRLSSGATGLGALLQAIQRYRDMGLDEDEIEARIRMDFPPVPRKSSLAAPSDHSHVDI